MENILEIRQKKIKELADAGILKELLDAGIIVSSDYERYCQMALESS